MPAGCVPLPKDQWSPGRSRPIATIDLPRWLRQSCRTAGSPRRVLRRRTRGLSTRVPRWGSLAPGWRRGCCLRTTSLLDSGIGASRVLVIRQLLVSCFLTETSRNLQATTLWHLRSIGLSDLRMLKQDLINQTAKPTTCETQRDFPIWGY